MNHKISLGLAVSGMALIAALTFILTMAFSTRVFNQKVSEVDRLSEKYRRLEELDKTVRKEFYTDIDDSLIMNNILAGYIAGLDDRYSTYMTAEDYTASQDRTAGVYTGIGISVQKTEQNEMLIVEVAENGPAKAAGLLADDIIIKIEEFSVSEDYEKAVNAISGEAGSYVHLTVRHAGDGKEQKISVERRVIDETTVQYEMLPNQIGYIRITKFRTVTVTQFETAMNELRTKGAVAMVFDVRDNGGGLLSALEEMLDPLLPEGEIAYAYTKSGEETVIVESDAEMLDMRYAVLMNGNTASAAELFACALRDYADALLVGEKTFGKGIMQTTFPLSDGSAVTLTTATYSTGKTPCYHNIGLEPDVLSVYDSEAESDTQLDDAQTALLTHVQDAAA